MPGRIIKLIISMIFFIFAGTGRRLGTLREGEKQPMLVIITYHPVKLRHAARFEKQMRMVQKIGKAVSLSESLSDLSAGLNIAVTFDDAYQSVLENALPILQARNIPATVFVPSGCLGQKPAWIRNPGHIYADETVMTVEQLKSLPCDLITIGSHTVSHINLNAAPEDTIRREAVDSKTALESLLNRKIILFAAPYAMMDKKHADILIQAGYKRAFLNIPTYPATKTDLFILGRNSVEPTDWPIEFHLKLSGAYQWLPLAINLKKKFTHQNGF